MSRNRKKVIGCALLLFLLVSLLFLPSLRYDFQFDWDDGLFIVTNPRMEPTFSNVLHYFLHPYQDLFTPLPMLSLMLDKALFGLKPFFFHLHNLFLHSAAACALFLLIRRLGVRLSLAFWGALLWAVHPQRVESVVWIVERKDLLCGLFTFLALWCFQKRSSLRCAVFSVLAIASKPAAVFLPFLLIVMTIGFSGTKQEFFRRLKQAVLPVLAGLGAVLWSGRMSAETMPGSIETNWLVPLHNLFWYPVSALIPFERNPVYPAVLKDPGEHWLLLAGGTLLFLLLLRAFRKNGFSWKDLFCMGAAPGLCMAPVLGLLKYTDFHYCDRYNYLVSACVFSLLFLLLNRMVRRGFSLRKTTVLSLAAAAVFALLALHDMPVWKNTASLVADGLARQGRHNIALLKISVYSALRTEDRAVLKRAADVMERELPFFRLHYPENMLRCSLLFMRGHVALISGDFRNGDRCYEEFIRRFRKGGKESALLWGRATNVLYHDLAVLSMLKQDPASARFYLERELLILEKKQDRSLRLWNAKAMKAELEQNIPELFRAWEEILRLAPDNPAQNRHYRMLRERYSEPEALIPASSGAVSGRPPEERRGSSGRSGKNGTGH